MQYISVDQTLFFLFPKWFNKSDGQRYGRQHSSYPISTSSIYLIYICIYIIDICHTSYFKAWTFFDTPARHSCLAFSIFSENCFTIPYGFITSKWASVQLMRGSPQCVNVSLFIFEHLFLPLPVQLSNDRLCGSMVLARIMWDVHTDLQMRPWLNEGMILHTSYITKILAITTHHVARFPNICANLQRAIEKGDSNSLIANETRRLASCQIWKIVGCACAGNAGNVFPATNFEGNR